MENIKHSTVEKVFESRESVIARGFRAKNYSIAMHDHDFYEINVILSGRGIHKIGGASLKTTVGDVFVIPPSVVHGYERESDDFDVYHLILKPDFLKRYSAELSGFSGFGLLFEAEPFIRERGGRAHLRLDSGALDFLGGCIDLLSSLINEDSFEADTMRSSLALTVIGYISRLVSMKRSDIDTTDSDGLAIAECLDFIHGNLSEHIDLDMLAARAKMSRATFIRRFKRLCGTSPYEYVRRRRLSEARRLIERGRSVTDAAHECGFYDASHLLKCLRTDGAARRQG